MCGLAGIFSYADNAPSVDRAELLRMREHMVQRGPDGAGLWMSPDQRVGLAHRRLAIIDLSDDGAQPMASADGRYQIVFNGEIYNYRELRAGLARQDAIFKSQSDTEVLLQLYRQHGADMCCQLRGMYAFAIWDWVEDSLFLARDPFGIKPLYIADDGRTLRFASQVKTLLAGGQVDTTSEPAGHAGYFLWGSVPAPWTLYRGIRNLTAGHYIKVTRKSVGKPTPFCLLNDVLAEAASQPEKGSKHEALEAIGAALRDSIRAHLVADVPVAMFLSAGLDSSMITALSCTELQSTAGDRPHTLTLSFAEYSGTANDEAPLAEQLAALLGTRHATLMVRREDYQEDYQKLLAAMDQPSIDGINTWFVARAAASQGIKVALSGLGGDELFASYPSFSDLPRITRLARPFTRLPKLGVRLRKIFSPIIARRTSPKYAGLLEYGGSMGGAYLLRRGLFMPWELEQVMDPDMAREGLDALRTLEQLDETHHSSQFSSRSSRLAVSALEMSWYMRHQLLRDTDWASMAHSLEVRTPLLDIPLLKAAAPWLAAHPDITKSEIAASLDASIPATLIKKPKTGFSIPVRDWLVKDQSSYHDRGMRGWARVIHQSYSRGAA